MLQLPWQGRKRRRSCRRHPQSEPAELYELQVPQEAERRGALLGHQEWQRRHGDGFTDSRRHQRRGSLDHHQLRAELLQGRRVTPVHAVRRGGGHCPPPFFLLSGIRISGRVGRPEDGEFGEGEPSYRIGCFQRRHHGRTLLLTELRFGRPHHLLIEIGNDFSQRHFTVTVHV